MLWGFSIRKRRKCIWVWYVILHNGKQICKSQFWRARKHAERYLKNIIRWEHENKYGKEPIVMRWSIQRKSEYI